MTDEELAEIVAAVKAELDIPTPTPNAIDLGMWSVVPGEVILADHVNSLVQMSIPKFPSAVALDAQWPTPPIGAFAYLMDVNALLVYDDSSTTGTYAWRMATGRRIGYARMGENQTIPVNTDTLVGLTSAGGPANKPGRGTWNADGSVTVPVEGTYLISASVTWPAVPGGNRFTFIQINPGAGWQVQLTSGGVQSATAGASIIHQGVTAQVHAGANWKIGLFASHTAAVPLTLPSGAQQAARMSIQYLGGD